MRGEDGIQDLVRYHGLGDVYEGQGRWESSLLRLKGSSTADAKGWLEEKFDGFDGIFDAGPV